MIFKGEFDPEKQKWRKSGKTGKKWKKEEKSGKKLSPFLGKCHISKTAYRKTLARGSN